MNYTRTCPSCNNNINYKTFEAFKVAIKKNVMCKTCRIGPELFFRNCPECNSVMGYAREENYLNGLKNNWKCQSCKNPSKKNNCKLCNIEMIYKTNPKEYCTQCLNKHRQSLIGVRNCPECKVEITYGTIGDKRLGESLNTVCEKCSGKKISLAKKGKNAHQARVAKGMNQEKSLEIWEISEKKRIKSREWYKHTPETLGKILQSAFRKYEVEGIRCQGNWERKYLEKLVNEKKEKPKNTKTLKTPLGSYAPDFEYSDRYVEIKSPFTFEIFNQTRVLKNNKLSYQKDKVEWVGANIKPIQLLVLDKNANIIIEEWYTPEGVKRTTPSKLTKGIVFYV